MPPNITQQNPPPVGLKSLNSSVLEHVQRLDDLFKKIELLQKHNADVDEQLKNILNN